MDNPMTLILKAGQDDKDQCHMICEVEDFMGIFEDNLHYTRKNVTHALLRLCVHLAHRRENERYFRPYDETREFLTWAKDYIEKEIQNMGSEEAIEAKHGKNPLQFRDARNYGWKEEEAE